MKALKSHPQIERPRRINSRITLAKYTAGLVLALVGLISAALMKGPIQPASAETVALGWSYTGFIRLSRVLWLGVLVVMLGGLLEPEAAAQTVSFGAKTDFGTGARSRSVAVGDFNGDGTLDLAVANENASLAGSGNDSATVSILLSTGTGSFGAKTDFSTGRASSVAVGDFNGDGKLDLVVASGQYTVSILLGTGTGSFGAKTDFGSGIGSSSVAVGDFNGDGKLDLAVANGANDTVSILLGTGTGSFGAKTDFATGSGPASVAVGDFNGDGKLDLAVANYNGATVSILLGTGTSSFGAKTDFGTGIGPASLAVGDFNGDGKLDLAVANPGYYFGGEYLGTDPQTVSILLGTGTGSFGAKTDFGTSGGPFSVAVGDFNADGNLDLAVANFDSNTVSILLGTGTGSFGAKIDFGTGWLPFSVAVGDFNGDGKLDLAVANLRSIFVNDPGPGTVSILLNTGPTLPNPIDDPQFFVRQHYLDFLNREPDPAGMAGWLAVLNNCLPGDTSCDRIHVSSAFFRSPEFQERGYFLYRFYSVAFGRKPDFNEFTPDLAKVSGFLTDAELEAAKLNFIAEFMNRPAFLSKFTGLSNTEYVDTLLSSADVTHPSRDFWIAALTNGSRTRSQVLREIAQSGEVHEKYYNQAFVVMQYFGYLRRQPDALYLNWIAHLDSTDDYRSMIHGFINSIEYRTRFGQP